MAGIEAELRELAEVFDDADEPQECDAKVAATCAEAADTIAEMRAALEAIVRDFGEPLPGCDCAYCRAKNRARATLAKTKQE